MRLLWKHLQNNRFRFALALCIGILYTAVCVVVPTISGRLINGFLENASIGFQILLVYLLCSGLQIVLFLLDQKASKALEIYQKQTMRGNVFSAISLHDCLSKEKTASIISFVNNDIPVASNQFFLGTIDIIKCVSLICFSAVSLINVHYILGLIVLLLSVSIVYVPNLMRRKSGEARVAYSEAMAAYNAQLQSFLGGLSVVASFRYAKRAGKFLEERNSRATASEIALCAHQRFVQGVTAFLQTAKTVLILTAGVMLIARNAINVGDLVIVLSLDEVIGAPIEYLSYMIHGKNEAMPLVQRYDSIVSAEASGPAGVSVMTGVEAIEVEDVSYSAGDIQILRGITVCFERGKKYIITGPSGSGKSTLLNILARMAEPTSGCVLVNGHNIQTISKETYRDKICAVFQEPYLFETTLEENILLGRTVPQTRYHEIIDRLQLSYLLERYAGQTVSPELAETLSGGEKQRVCLARAMVGQPEFYLLDEVTSALDKGTAHAVETALLSEKAAVIHVCHKPVPELREQYDVHLQMEQGALKRAES